MRLARPTAAALFLALASLPLRADDLDYSVTDYAPATIKVAGDGTVFVDYVAPQAGATYWFTMNVWVESGQAATPFPTVLCPVQFMRLSGVDATSWFSSSPTSVSFDGYGTDPTPDRPGPGYTGIPGGSYRAVRVSFTIPATGLPSDRIQVKVKARTQGIRFLGEGHGVIVRFSQDAPCAFTITSWLSDTKWVPMSDPCYKDTFQVVTRCGSLSVASTNPGGFYYNVLIATHAPVAHLAIDVSPLPCDMVLWGANSVHAYVGDVDVSDPSQTDAIALGRSLHFECSDLRANTTVLLTVHNRFGLCALPSATYLPRVYTYSSAATDGVCSKSSSASMTGVRKR